MFTNSLPPSLPPSLLPSLHPSHSGPLFLSSSFSLPLSFLSPSHIDTHCSEPDEFPLNFDLFMELLSNHSSIARNLTRAPIFADMDSDSPAYEITGRGFHFTDKYMSKDIKRVCTDLHITV